MSTRRTFLGRACAALFAAPALSAQTMQMPMQMPMPPATPAPQPPQNPRRASRPIPTPTQQTPVVTPDVGDLPYTIENGAKVFHLVAEVLRQKIHPDKTIDLWGFNGSAPGPTIQVNQGDHVRVIFENHLPEASSIHWHGLEDLIGDDGMPGISQEPVKPGGRFVYEFDIHQSGTYFYHSHMAMQEMAGMLGGFIMHPSTPYHPHCDKDFLLHLQEYAVLPNNTVPNTMNMEYNWLLLNGKAGPASTPLIVHQGDRVRIRFVNLGMDHHPLHIHGYTFQVTGTEGGRIPETAWWPGTTVLVGVAQARDIEINADRAGDWMLHCHLPHHMMNQMSSNVGSMTRRPGMGQPAGVDMNTGMGMLQGTPGAPSGDDYGTSLGRGMGFGSTADMATANGPLAQPKAMDAMPGMAGMAAEIAPNANAIPGFPQDAYMEGPAMAMDERVAKPENYGLRAGWSGYMMGMMNFLRVLPADKYDEVITRMKQANRANDPYASLLQKNS
jgi:manganese oxidase